MYMHTFCIPGSTLGNSHKKEQHVKLLPSSIFRKCSEIAGVRGIAAQPSHRTTRRKNETNSSCMRYAVNLSLPGRPNPPPPYELKFTCI